MKILHRNIGKIITTFCLFSLGFSSYAQQSIPDATEDGIQAVKTWASSRITSAENEFTTSGGLRYGSPNFWGNESVYQIFVDRFNNGDTSNDLLNIQGNQVQYQNSPDTWEIQYWRHGGDLQGIIDRLDYLDDLGITSLWITPIFGFDGLYHGYCTTDQSQIDVGFGSDELFRELVRQAHMRDIKVILDIVVNHMCDPNTYYSQQANHYQCANDMNSNNWNGVAGGSSSQGTLHFSDNFFPALKNQYFFNRCGPNSSEDMQGTGNAAIYGDFRAGMYDFDTRNHDFQQIMTDLQKYWIAYADVDGYRLDAVKHVSEDFLAYFSTEIREYAKSIGKDNFYIIGEVAGPADWIGRRIGKMYHDTQNPDNHGKVPATLTERIWDVRNTYLGHGKQNFPGMTAAYDFDLSGSMRESLQNNRWFSSVNNHFSSAYYQTIAAQQDPRLNLMHMEIHDWQRYVHGKHKDNPWKSSLALSFLATMQGIPITYYGQEQGFNADCLFSRINAGAATSQVQSTCGGGSHGLYRQNMFESGMWRLGSTVDEINDLAYIGPSQARVSPQWQLDPYLNRQHHVYKTARRFNYIRQSCDALRMGNIVPRLSWDSSSGLLAFSRIHDDQEILVIANSSSGNITLPNITIDGGLNGVNGHEYMNLTNGFERGTVVKSGSNTYLNFNGMQISGNSVKVFVHENNATGWDPYIESHICTDNPIYKEPANAPPIANAGLDQQVQINTPFILSASASTDSDGSIVSYRWDHESFSEPLSTEDITLSFDDTGNYTFTLTVTDDSGATSEDTVTVAVRDSNENWQRTVILIYGRTEQGQDMFFRGGIDSAWSNANRGTQCESQIGGDHNLDCSIGIRHLNTLHSYTYPWRTGDNYLDWGKLTTARNGREATQTGTNNVGELAEGTPAIWTTNNCASSNVVSEQDLQSSCNSNPQLYGGGFTTLNNFGEHFWMLDVEMNCDDTVNGWFEFKSYISNGPGWETALNQTEFGELPSPSYSSGNHFAACGQLNVYRRNQNNPIAITHLPQ